MKKPLALNHIKIMRIFGIGLEESVMKEPTNINLADWSNLCLFRLAIIKRKLGTIKAIVDETKIPPNLFKLYAFLYKIYDVNNFLLIFKQEERKIFFNSVPEWIFKLLRKFKIYPYLSIFPILL